MANDDDFEPRLGRLRDLGRGRGKSYLSRILRSAMLASGGTFGRAPRRTGFTGARSGRAAGVAPVLAARDHLAAYRARRVIVKFSLPRLSGKGIATARAHMRYIQRDGVTPVGAPGQLYDAGSDQADGRASVDRAEAAQDSRQSRFIVSPEDGAEYDDLNPLIRRLMTQMEADLDTRLDWVAVDHHNTGHPHTHVIVRGRDDQGQDLVIAKDYLTPGLRERAAELVSLDLGPHTDNEIEGRLFREVDQERLTSLDRALLRGVEEDGLVSPRHADPRLYTARARRLQTLARLGLAQDGAPTRWRLVDGLEDTLRRMGERGDIQKTLYPALAENGVERASGDRVIYEPSAAGARPLVGRVVARGLSDELKDHHYLVVDGLDGRAHYVELGRGRRSRRYLKGRWSRSRLGPCRRVTSITLSPVSPRTMTASTASTSTWPTIPRRRPPSPRRMYGGSKRCGAARPASSGLRTEPGESAPTMPTRPPPMRRAKRKLRPSSCARSPPCRWIGRWRLSDRLGLIRSSSPVRPNRSATLGSAAMYVRPWRFGASG